MRLFLPQSLAEIIDEESKKAAPLEACGLLIGQELRVERLVISPNLAVCSNRFEIDPGLLLKESRLARENGQRIIGHYHSHPNGQAYPSAHDLAMSFYPDWLWLIWAAGKINAFKIDEENYQEVEIITLPA